ncbi:MAG: transcription repressor NadR [Erysipelotrichales bacterium]
MDANTRREEIIKVIKKSNNTPISASKIAKRFNVSRQIIVGDIALLRANGNDIIATPRGYVMMDNTLHNKYVGKCVSLHDANDIKDELYTIVDLDGIVMNVIVDHEIYGEITGNLDLRSREDVDLYLSKLDSSKAVPLSILTKGIHIHTIICRDKDDFDTIIKELEEKNFIFNS